jgi:acyl-CoA dehydrogenase
LAERTGQLGEAGAWAGRQVVGRYFICGFGDAAQRAALLPRLAAGQALIAIAISEPGVGAHPKHLTTQAEPDGDGVRITGRKAWVSNGPGASHFVVLAVSAMDGARKRYSAYLVPRETAGLSLHPMPDLPDGRHCILELAGCRVPHSARLGPAEDAYEAMALPLRDVEDTVELSKLAGGLRFVMTRLVSGAVTPEAKLAVGGLVALTTVLTDGAAALADMLDAGGSPDASARLVGLRLLVAELVQWVRTYLAAHGPVDPGDIAPVLTDIDLALSIARGPRQVRQARLVDTLRG